MKKILTLICLVALSVLTVKEAYAAEVIPGAASSAGQINKVGAAGSQFLKIPIGTRATGMAGANGAAVNDLSCLFWNPAALVTLEGAGATVEHTTWFANYGVSFAAASLPISEQFAVAASIISLSSGDIEETTMDFQDGTGGNYSVQDLSAQLTFSGKITDQFSFGVTAKYLNNKIANLSSGGFAFDIGTLYDTGIQGIKIGFSIHNFGGDMRYDGQNLRTEAALYSNEIYQSELDASYLSSTYSAPVIFRAGLSSEIYNEGDNAITAAFDFVTHSDIPEQFAFGAEYVWKEFLSLRGGYNIGHDNNGVAFGVGLKYFTGGMTADFGYSMTPAMEIDQLVHRVGVSLHFGN